MTNEQLSQCPPKIRNSRFISSTKKFLSGTSNRYRLIVSLSLLIVCDAFAHHTLGFIESDLARPDGGAWAEAVGVTFQDNGRIWVWERGGQVWIIDDSNPVPNPFLAISDEVGAWHDHGFLGFALDPDFSENGFVYLLYLVDRHHLIHCAEPLSGSGPPICDAGYDPAVDQYFDATIGRVTRYQALLPSGDSDYSNAASFDASSRTVLVGSTASNGIPSTSRSHVTGSLVFGTDGSLLVTTGDGSRSANDTGSSSTIGDDKSYTIQALADGIIDAQQDVGANRAQMVDSLSGKVLRVDPGTGAGLPDNPFFDAASPGAARSKVWALGLRNPYRASLWPDSGSHSQGNADPGTLFIGDVGRNAWEEINIVEAAGQNFGWPIYEGMNLFSGSSFGNGQLDNVFAPNPLFNIGGCTEEFFQFDDLLVQETTNPLDFPNPCDAQVQIDQATPAHMHTRPTLAWLHQSATTKSKGFDAGGIATDYDIDDPASPIQGVPFPGSSVTGGFIYQGTDLPAEFAGNYFFGDYTGQWIRRLVFDQANNAVSVEEFSDGAEAGGVVHLASSPEDGGVYFIPWTIAVKRLDYAPNGNFPPQASLLAGPVSGPAPLTTNFDASGSTDPEGTALSYLWDFGDGNSATSAITQHTYNATGIQSFNAVLTVTDADGGVDTASVVVSPNNTPPVVTIISPVDGTFYPPSSDTTYDLIADISDNEHPVSGMECTWSVRLHHNTHFHGGPPLQGCQTQAVISPEGCDGESYFWEVEITVKDPAGLIAIDSVRLDTPDCGGGNLSPVANGDYASVSDGGIVTIGVLNNDIDDVGFRLDSVVLTAPFPTNGIATVNLGTGEIDYQHTGPENSTDTFTYRVNDTDGATSNKATVIVQSSVQNSTPVTMQVVRDSFTRFTSGNTNFGTASVVRIQPWGNSTGFAYFDLSSFPAGVAAQSAQLVFSTDSVRTNGTVRIHKVLGNWAELSITENNQPPLGPVETSFAVTSADNGQSVTLDITDLFNQLHLDPGNNHGFAMTQSGANIWIDSRESGSPMQIIATPGGPPTNSAPQVSAGSDFSVAVSNTIGLGGSVSDDGLPSPPSSVTALWSIVSGPGTVTLSNTGDPGTNVSFDMTGVYVLRLTGDDSVLQSSDDVIITVVEPSSEQTFAVIRDSFTRFTSGNTNFGAQAVVRVQPWGDSTGFVYFDLNSFPAGVMATSAQLEFSIDSVKTAGVVNIRRVLGNWTESGITENNQPALGPVISSFNIASADDGQTVQVDATGIFNQLHADPGNNFGLALTQSGANIWIDSRESGSPMQLIATPGGPPGNTAPQVNAGGNQTIFMPDDASLAGSVNDDGLPTPPGQTTVSWDLLSGPDTVNFGNQGNLNTSVSFALPGLYEIRLTADDSELTASDTLLIDVIDPNANQPPSVDAGADFSVASDTEISLNGSISDDGLPNPPATTTASWSKISGPGSVDFEDSSDPVSDVSFDTDGTYVLRLTANDDELERTDDVTVTVLDSSGPQSFEANQDTFVRDSTAGGANTNFGSDALVRVQSWGNGTAFVRFDLSSFPAGTVVSSAQLIISADDVKRSGIVTVHKVLGAWQELSLTDNNKPALGPETMSFNVSTSDGGEDIQIDITDVFNQLIADPGNDYGIAMAPNGVNLWINSRESGSPMRIVATSGQASDLAFTDITTSSGTGGPAHFGGHGIQFADIDNSGLPDFYVTMNETSFGDMPDLMYKNTDGAQFTEEASARGIDDFDSGSHGSVFGDFDNDGDFDLYNGSFDQNNLYLNNGSGVFTDSTLAAGLPARQWPTRGVAAFDMDLDGDLDIVAINGFLGSGDPSSERNEFYRNDGNAVFTSVDMEPLFSAPSGQGLTDVDYDNDGDIDLFTANRNGDVVILRNVSGSGFELVAPASIGINHIAEDGISFADVNNDGHLDVLLDDELYISDQDGTFTHSASLTGPAIPYMGGFADFDLDGDIDIVFPGANFVYLNDGSGTFAQGPGISLGTVNDPRSVAFADIENDGDVDFFYAQKRSFNILVRNDYSGSNRWLKVSLIRSNGQAGAFGSRVYIYKAGELNDPDELITWREVRSQDGYLSQSDPRISMGVGDNDFVDIKVVFPGGGETTLLNMATTQHLIIQE